MHGRNMRVGHVRDETDPDGEEAGVVFGAGNALGELGLKLPADSRDVDPDLLEHLAGHLAANPAPTTFGAGLSRRIGPVPRREGESGIGTGLAFDLLKSS